MSGPPHEIIVRARIAAANGKPVVAAKRAVKRAAKKTRIRAKRAI